ncbi:OmpA family protein [Pseudonocardia sp.]|uniref:OmpA family protein n=1 Tax=Pseudonocardia sp. TaxID=60912 RepID=UPI003D0DEF0A
MIVASATAAEPAPSLTPMARAELRAIAEHPASGHRPGSGVAFLSTADRAGLTEFSLVPRRANGDIENGHIQRARLIDENVTAVATAVGRLAARRDGLDLLEGIARAVRGLDGGLLVVVSNGLSTTGGLDMRQVGWLADPVDVASELRSRRLLPSLRGWRVLLVGLGMVAGAQPAPGQPQHERLVAYWSEICAAAGAESYTIDDLPIPATPPSSRASMPLVPVPATWSVVGPDGRTTTTITDNVLGFRGESAVIPAAGRALLARVAAEILARSAAPVEVRGFTADPPGWTPEGTAALARRRSDAVAATLTGAGITEVRSLGGGVAPGMTAVVDGRFVEALAARMRRVEITY